MNMARPGSRKSVMSMHMGGPRTPAEIAFAREEHRKKLKRAAESTFVWEDEPELMDVLAYLKKTGRGDLCSDIMDCRPGRYEPQLVSDLMEARRQDDHDKVQQLRGLILAGSKPANRNASPRDAHEALRELISEDMIVQSRIGRTDPDEAKERGEAIDSLREVARAIQNEQVGESIEDETKTIEDRFELAIQHVLRERNARARKQAIRDLHRHRQVRDEIYYSRLYPGKAETRNVMLVPSAKPSHAV